VHAVTGRSLDRMFMALGALAVGFIVAAHVLPSPWTIAYAGVVQVVVLAIVVRLVAAFWRDRR
jgi:hypothetical protein